jgi:putative transposase
MDGKGRWVDNVFVERLWRSVKYECVYLQEWENVLAVKEALHAYFQFYNYDRPHQSLSGLTPSHIHGQKMLH